MPALRPQNKVEASLAAEGLNRHLLGREKFLERFGNGAINLAASFGSSCANCGAACDWQRECFTMDEHRSRR